MTIGTVHREIRSYPGLQGVIHFRCSNMSRHGSRGFRKRVEIATTVKKIDKVPRHPPQRPFTVQLAGVERERMPGLRRVADDARSPRWNVPPLQSKLFTRVHHEIKILASTPDKRSLCASFIPLVRNSINALDEAHRPREKLGQNQHIRTPDPVVQTLNRKNVFAL